MSSKAKSSGTEKVKGHRSFEEISGLIPVKYDLFCSYTRSDNHDRLVDKIIEAISQDFRALTGEKLRIFIDRSDIKAADFWKTKIAQELRQSRLLLALISPSYFKSEWCRLEWFNAEHKEELINVVQRSPLISGVIVPVLIYPLAKARLTSDEKLFVSSVKQRQWHDLQKARAGTVKFQQSIRNLVEDIIENLDGLRSIVPEKREDDSDSIITDSRTGLMWAGVVPPVQMKFEEAKKYVSSLTLGGYADWRLPSEVEIKSLLEQDLIPDDPHSSPVPLRQPFNSPRYGYLMTGTILESVDKGYYVMNVRNGHIFNGKGFRCFVRAVRGPDPSVMPKKRRTKASSRRPKGRG